MEEDQCQLLLVTTGKNYPDFIHSVFNELHIWRMRKMYHQKEGSIRIYFCLKTKFSRIWGHLGAITPCSLGSYDPDLGST